jgi:hypothetical protein
MKLDLLTNATVVEDAIRFVAGMSKANDTRSQQENERHEQIANNVF